MQYNIVANIHNKTLKTTKDCLLFILDMMLTASLVFILTPRLNKLIIIIFVYFNLIELISNLRIVF